MLVFTLSFSKNIFLCLPARVLDQEGRIAALSHNVFFSNLFFHPMWTMYSKSYIFSLRWSSENQNNSCFRTMGSARKSRPSMLLSPIAFQLRWRYIACVSDFQIYIKRRPSKFVVGHCCQRKGLLWSKRHLPIRISGLRGVVSAHELLWVHK